MAHPKDVKARSCHSKIQANNILGTHEGYCTERRTDYGMKVARGELPCLRYNSHDLKTIREVRKK